MRFESLPHLVNRSSLVAAPFLFLLSGIAIPRLENGDAAQVALIQAHPTGWYLFTLFNLTGSAALVPAALALMRATGARSASSVLGAGLLAVGGLVALADSATQLVYWQMGARSANAAQMVALLHRYENAPAASAIFMVGALAFVVGCILLAFALARTQAAPVWVAVLFPVSAVANIGAFTAGNRILLIVSSVTLLVALGRVAWGSRPLAAAAATTV
ncbi:MAG TPA: hypothetical protein VJ814_07080 [Gaiellaceae bacterium]|nr:hypothetical protein [Gaiellaceae bacterium]